jgi:pimeloyl-ACP methyl ester carboxylesterase
MSVGLEGEADRVEELRATGLPVLVVHGEDDDAWTPAAAARHGRTAGFGYAVIPDAVHSPAVEQPEATAKALLAFSPSRGDL